MADTTAAKVRYVKSQGQTRDHHCHWPGCPRQVPPAKWGCSTHWFMLPKHLRDAVWRTFEPGQEKTFTPSREYLEVADKVQAWIRDYEAKRAAQTPQQLELGGHVDQA